jgi:hypothetical protein
MSTTVLVSREVRLLPASVSAFMSVSPSAKADLIVSDVADANAWNEAVAGA